MRAVDGVELRRASRPHARHRRRKRLRQERHRALDPAASSSGPGRVEARRDLAAPRRRRAASTSPSSRPTAPEMRAIRGGEIGLIFQEPMTSFSHYTRSATRSSRRSACTRDADARRRRARARSSCCAWSACRSRSAASTSIRSSCRGGLRQRVMIAHGARLRAAHPDRRRADHRARRHHPGADPRPDPRPAGSSAAWRVILITHDMGVIAEMADDVVVMYLGREVEKGPVDDIFHAPQASLYARAAALDPEHHGGAAHAARDASRGSIPHPFNRARRLPLPSALSRIHAGRVRHERSRRRCARARRARGAAASSTAERRHDDVLEVVDLRKHFPIRRGFLRRIVGHVRAVDDVSFHIRKGETLSLVGESGCGKTTTSRCILRALAPTAGEIRFRVGRHGGRSRDAAAARAASRCRRQMQMIFQDPFSSLNPRMTIADIIGEPLLVNGMRSARAAARSGSPSCSTWCSCRAPTCNRFPHAFSRRPAPAHRHRARARAQSGADRGRRAGLRARRLGAGADPQPDARPAGPARPHLPVRRARPQSVVKHVSDRVAVMYVGRIVEIAPHRRRSSQRRSIPTPRRCSRRCRCPTRASAPSAIVLEREVADPANPPPGCHFHPRCRYAQERCRVETPPLQEIEQNRWVSCHRARELSLNGVR